jgi:hypothetical protein
MNILETKKGTVKREFEYEYETEGKGGETITKKEKVSLTLKRGAFNLDFEQALADAKGEPRRAAAAIAERVIEWSLNADGEPFPPTAENIGLLESDFLGCVVKALAEKGNPTKPAS